MRCPGCEDTMTFETEKEFYYCPSGCGEWWPDVDDEFVGRRAFWDEIKSKKKACLFKGSGGRKGRRDDKQKKRKHNYFDIE